MSIRLPPPIESIGSNAFMNCSMLMRMYVDAGSSLTRIGTRAFWGSVSLSVVSLPVGLSSIGIEAFHGAGTSESSSGVVFYFEHGNSMIFSIGHEVEFFGCQNASVYRVSCNGGVIRDGHMEVSYVVSRLMGGSFQSCGALTSVSFEEGSNMMSIESNVFSSSGLKVISLPASLTSVVAD